MEKEKILLGLRSGGSLASLSLIHTRSKLAIYYYYKKINGKRFVSPHVRPKWAENEGEIVGIFAGDGSQHHDTKGRKYQVNVHFGSRNLLYAHYVQNLFENFFLKSFRLSDEGACLRLRMESRDIYDYFSNYRAYDPSTKHATVQLHSTHLPGPFLLGFLRGLFDTDGFMLYNTHDKSIRTTFHTSSPQLAVQVQGILSKFTILHTAYQQQ